MKKRYEKPSYEEAAAAARHWAILYDYAAFFERAHMSGVSKHLVLAAREIDRIWGERDYTRKRRA